MIPFPRLHSLFARLLLLGALVTPASGVWADGVVAAGKSGPPHAAIVVNEDYSRAESDALNQCGKNCEVVERFRMGCASFATGQYAMGYSMGATGEEASYAALQQCRRNGDDCATRLTRCESHEQTPGAADARQSQQRLLSSRSPDAVVDLPPRTLHSVSLSRSLPIPKGTRLIAVSPAALANAAPTPPDTERMIVVDCEPFERTAPKWKMFDPPCRANGIPVPKSLIVPSGKTLGSPDHPVPVFVTSGAFALKYTQSQGYVGAGTRLYKAPDPQPTPGEAGYSWAKDAGYTWFYVDPAACETGGKVFDCSQPSPFDDKSWKPIDGSTVAPAASSTAPAPGDDTWAVAGVRTGMSAAEARAALEHEGLQVTSASSYYQYRHPITDMLVADKSVGMLALLTGTSPGAPGSAPAQIVNVLLTPVPGAERVYAVWEQMQYTRVMGQAVSLDNLRKAALDEFGAAQIDTSPGAGNYVMYWPADKSLSRLKPWFRESELSLVASECGSRAVSGTGITLTYSGYSPLTSGVGPTVEGMRAHCSERFVAAHASLAPTGSSATELGDGLLNSRVEIRLSAKVPVFQYEFWLYDGHEAQGGQDALRSAEAALTARAAKAQQDAGANVKPKL